MSALLWEDPAFTSYWVLVCWMQLHGLRQVLTLTMDFDSIRDMKFAGAESRFGMKWLIEQDLNPDKALFVCCHRANPCNLNRCC